MNEATPLLPHIGNMMRTHIKKNRLFKSVLARLLGRNYSTVHKYERKPSMQCKLLWELSLALKHNFFMDLAAKLPASFTTYAPDPTLSIQAHNAVLEAENKMLIAKVATLLEAIRK